MSVFQEMLGMEIDVKSPWERSYLSPVQIYEPRVLQHQLTFNLLNFALRQLQPRVQLIQFQSVSTSFQLHLQLLQLQLQPTFALLHF